MSDDDRALRDACDEQDGVADMNWDGWRRRNLPGSTATDSKADDSNPHDLPGTFEEWRRRGFPHSG